MRRATLLAGGRAAGGTPPTTTGRGGRRWPVAVALVAALASGGGASAYDPATTHAGLTQRAVLASCVLVITAAISGFIVQQKVQQPHRTALTSSDLL